MALNPPGCPMYKYISGHKMTSFSLWVADAASLRPDTTRDSYVPAGGVCMAHSGTSL